MGHGHPPPRPEAAAAPAPGGQRLFLIRDLGRTGAHPYLHVVSSQPPRPQGQGRTRGLRSVLAGLRSVPSCHSCLRGHGQYWCPFQIPDPRSVPALALLTLASQRGPVWPGIWSLHQPSPWGLRLAQCQAGPYNVLTDSCVALSPWSPAWGFSWALSVSSKESESGELGRLTGYRGCSCYRRGQLASAPQSPEAAGEPAVSGTSGVSAQRGRDCHQVGEMGRLLHRQGGADGHPLQVVHLGQVAEAGVCMAPVELVIFWNLLASCRPFFVNCPEVDFVLVFVGSWLSPSIDRVHVFCFACDFFLQAQKAER